MSTKTKPGKPSRTVHGAVHATYNVSNHEQLIDNLVEVQMES